MTQIHDMNTYLTRMDASLPDKCWWLDHIPDTISTVIDFGCAAGNLKTTLDELAPGRFNYIGIDNSPDMLAICKDKGLAAYGDISEARYDPAKTILVLNSVIHEILHYMSKEDSFTLLSQLCELSIKYIAIRDMNIGHSRDSKCSFIVSKILQSRFAAKWEDYINQNPHSVVPTVDQENVRVKEFLLKYWYEENWERERDEQYLFNIGILGEYWLFINPEYQIVHDSDFYIPWVRNKIHDDFGVWYDEPTHKKMLLKLKGD